VSGVGQGVALAQRKPGSPMWWLAEYCPDLEPTHIAFPTDAESLSRMRTEIQQAINDEREQALFPSIADAVMRLLFGQGGEGT
jgi:hypothetical protein